VHEGRTQEPDCTLAITEADLLAMTAGEVDAMKLFTTGKLRISGNVMASQKLAFLTAMDPEQAKDAVRRARAAGEGPSAAGSPHAVATPAAAQAPAIMAALTARLATDPSWAARLGGRLCLRVREPAAAWIIDATCTPATVTEAEGDAQTTVSLPDAELAALARGDKSAAELFQRGTLRVDGDMALARWLDVLEGLI